MQKIYRYFVFLLLLSLPSVSWSEDSAKQSNVLVIHSYHKGFSWTDELQKGLDETLSPKSVNLTIRYLDSQNIRSSNYEKKLYLLYKEVLTTTAYDAVIVTNPNALELVKKLQTFIADTPIFFAGVDSFNLEKGGCKNITGVYNPLTPEKAVNLIQKSQPNVETIYVVTDYSNIGKGARESLKQYLAQTYSSHPSHLSRSMPQIISVVPDDIEGTFDLLAHLPENSAVFYWSYFRNKAGRMNDLLPIKDLIKEINAPVYIDYDLNTDADGEFIHNQGYMLGELVVDYLNHPDKEIPQPVLVQHMLKVDYNSVEKWQLKPNENILILNQPKKFWQGKEKLIALFFVLCLVFISIIVLLLRHIRRVRSSEKRSLENQYLLETIYDVSNQSIGILDSKGHILSTNQKLQELVTDPNFNHDAPFWQHSGWTPESRKRIEQSFHESFDKGMVRLEGELVYSNVGPVVFDMSINKLPAFIGDGNQYLLEAKDITARKLTEKRLIESEVSLRNYYELQPVMMMTLDKHDSIQAVNQFTSQLLGYKPTDMLGRKLKDFYADPQELNARQVLLRPKEGGSLVWQREVRYFSADKRILCIRENIRQIIETRQLLIVAEDVSEMRLLSEQLEYQAHHDNLTHLYNRNYFEQQLHVALQEVKTHLRSHALFYLDLDQFKLINDTVGHEAGDAAIIYSAELLRKLAPKERTVIARTAGDEFGIIFRDCTMQQIEEFAREILDAFTHCGFSWRDIHLNLTCSIGIRMIDHTASSPQMVQAQADTACHLAKEGGRNRSHFYRVDNEEFQRREQEMQCVNQVYDAIKHGRIDLYAQEIVDITDVPNNNMHFEILMRMRDQDNNLMSPGIFMPAVERYNLANLIDKEVFQRTIHWLEEHPQALERLGRCSINLSGQSMSDIDFIDFLIRLLQSTTVPLNKICIEITETAAVNNMQQATEFFTRLKDLGCKIALDDFGSGLSSFAYLKTLPIDIVKIDGSFVRDVHTSEMNHILVESINDLAKKMGKQTVAEYVENKEILACLKELKVDYAQGYLFSVPTPLEKLVEELMPAGDKS